MCALTEHSVSQPNIVLITQIQVFSTKIAIVRFSSDTLKMLCSDPTHWEQESQTEMVDLKRWGGV